MLSHSVDLDAQKVPHPDWYTLRHLDGRLRHDNGKDCLANLVRRHAPKELAEERVNVYAHRRRSALSLCVNPVSGAICDHVDELDLDLGVPAAIRQPGAEGFNDASLITDHGRIVAPTAQPGTGARERGSALRDVR